MFHSKAFFLPDYSHRRLSIILMEPLPNTRTEKTLLTCACNHEEDFGISAEWHFAASAHGKGACDGLGGTVKRLAARASLQKPYND